MNTEKLKKETKVSLPLDWHYNEKDLRMEKTVEVRDENDELIGYNEHTALVPSDILEFIDTAINKAVAGERERIVELVNSLPEVARGEYDASAIERGALIVELKSQKTK